MATVDVVIPSRHGQPAKCSSALTQMIIATVCRCGDHPPWECPNGKHSVRIVPTQLGASVVHWARNRLLTAALYGTDWEQVGRPPSEFLFLMDDDMMSSPGDLSRLLNHNRSFVTGISTIRQDPPRPNIRHFNAENKTWDWVKSWDWDSDKPFEVDGVGAAYMLIRRKVFDRMTQAYLNCVFEREEDRQKYPKCLDIDLYWNNKAAARRARFDQAIAKDGDWNKANCWWFQFLKSSSMEQDDELGEDISFCWKARQLGYKIWADPQVLPGHLGDYDYSVSDYRYFVEESTLRGAKIEKWDGKVGIHGMDSQPDSGGSSAAHGEPCRKQDELEDGVLSCARPTL